MAAVLIGTALLTAACGGSSPADGTGANRTPLQQALALARCMRSHGAPHYPGPNSSGVFDIGRMQSLGIDTNSPQFSAALTACGF